MVFLIGFSITPYLFLSFSLPELLARSQLLLFLTSSQFMVLRWIVVIIIVVVAVNVISVVIIIFLFRIKKKKP